MTRPALFLDLDFQAALDRSKAEAKLLLVDATASWCQPCQSMDKTTWVDETVAARLGEIAIPIQLDVDQDQATAKALRIQAMPTIVLFRDGVELARISGTRSPAALLGWIDDALAGRVDPDPMATAEKATKDLIERFKLFRSLLDGEKFDEASEHGIWLWTNMVAVSPPMVGLKHTVLVADLKRLAAAHPVTATTLREVRDATPTEELESIRDWVSLNAALGDDDKTIGWFDGVADTLGGNEELAHLVRFNVVPVLVERGRWRDVGRAYPDPMAAIRKSIETRKSMNDAPIPPEHKERLRESATKGFREDCGLIVRGLRAANRTAEADEVAAAAIEADPTPEMKAALEGTE